MRLIISFFSFTGAQSSTIAISNPTHASGVQSPTTTIYNLTQTSDGIHIELPLPCGRLVPHRLETYGFDGPYSLDCYDDGAPFVALPIGPISNYARRVDSVMLLPPSASTPSFRLVESMSDPTAYCFEGTIGMAAQTSRLDIAFSASVALIPNDGSSPQTAIFNTISRQGEYLLNSVDSYDVLPAEYVRAIIAEIHRLDIDTSDDESIALLPSIEYTIYRSQESSDVIARIVLAPRDYMGLREDAPWPLVFPNHSRRLQIGLNTLKYVGLFIDHRNRQIGFCEPL